MKIESLNLSSKEPIVTKLKQLEKEMQTVVLAEDIALVRCELTTKIMEENLPSENWAKVTFEILKKYPQLESYKNIFLKTMEEAQKTNNTINQIWKSKILKTTRTDNKNYELSSFDVANQKNSKNLFEEIFQKNLKEKSEL